jgi:hypothetical protein
LAPDGQLIERESAKNTEVPPDISAPSTNRMEFTMRSIVFISALASALAVSAAAWADPANPLQPRSYDSQVQGATGYPITGGFFFGGPRGPMSSMYEGRSAYEGGGYVYTPQGPSAPAGAPPVQYTNGGAGGYTNVP